MDLDTMSKMTELMAGFKLPLGELDREAVQQFHWQEDAAKELSNLLFTRGHKGAVLQAGTGIGKMYITAMMLRDMLAADKIKAPTGSINPFPILWVCPKTAKPQTLRVLRDFGIQQFVMVVSYGELRSSTGESMFVTWVTNPLTGEIEPVYHTHMRPCIVVVDEAQNVKNQDSLQSKTIRFLPDDVKVLFVSATLAQRVIDARCVIERCGIITKFNALPADRKTAPAIMRAIASPRDPSKYNQASMNRLREALEPYTVQVKNVRFKFPAQTVNTLISFTTPEQRQAYEDAHNEYLRECWEQKKRQGGTGMLVAWLKFRQKAELLRADELASRCVERINAGNQVIIASNFVDTLRAVYTILVKKHGISPGKISFIVGGQSSIKRQEHVDKFQSGDTDVLLFTMRSGGSAISLHHDRDCSRPRYIILPPTWSAIDLVQALGRAHRLTSKSKTIQEIMWFRDTIEEHVKDVVDNKVKCLSKLVTTREQWVHIFNAEAAKAAEEQFAREEEAKAQSDKEVEGGDDDDITGDGLDNQE